MNIAQVNYQDVLGGAEKVAMQIHNGLMDRGHQSILYVANRISECPGIEELNPDTDNSAWAQTWINLARLFEAGEKKRVNHYAAKLSRALARPSAFRRWWQGKEEFGFDKTHMLLQQNSQDFEILHLHNLHGGFFDLRLLPKLTRQQPVLITLHDEWLYTGHCGYSADCIRWQQQCGQCPDLEAYPAIRIDNTSNNLRLKKQIYSESNFFLTTPSNWLLERVKSSVIADSIIDSKVINNGVDTSIYKPENKFSARLKTGINDTSFVGLFVANHFKTGKAKDFNTIYQAMKKLAANNLNKHFVLLAIGEALGNKKNDNLELITLPYIADPKRLACYYQSADVYLHAAHTEIWGLTVTEAMACGIPVIATATGGIREQVCSLPGYANAAIFNSSEQDVTGILVDSGNSEQMTAALQLLLNEEKNTLQMGRNASIRVRKKYSEEVMLQSYLDWYSEILALTGNGIYEPSEYCQ